MQPGSQATTREAFRFRKQRGVNLGAWFVLERWLVPRLFAERAGDTSEADLVRTLGAERARDLLARHYDSWVTRDDLELMRRHGFNTLRLPIGFWHLGADYCALSPEYAPFASVYKGALERIASAIALAAEFDFGVLLDLHGAPGSQNGEAHSGVSRAAGLFDSDAAMKGTIAALCLLARRFAGAANVVGLELLNEPRDVGALRGFYTRALKALAVVLRDEDAFPIYLSDAWRLEGYAEFLREQRDACHFPLVLDAHFYYCHDPSLASRSAAEITLDVQSMGAALRGQTWSNYDHRIDVVVGEWSAALKPESLALSAAQGVATSAALAPFAAAQLEAYTTSCSGWFYWTYRTGDDDGPWSLRYCLRSGLLTVAAPRFSEEVYARAAQKHDALLRAAIEGMRSYWEGKVPDPEWWRHEHGWRQGYAAVLRLYRCGGAELGLVDGLCRVEVRQHERYWRAQGAQTVRHLWMFRHGWTGGANKCIEVIAEST